MIEAHRAYSLLKFPFIARAYLIGLGTVAVVWAFLVFPTAWRDSTLERIANRVIQGQVYKIDVLLNLIPLIDNVERSELCRPASVRSAAIIRLRLVEETIKFADRLKIDERLDELRASIRNSLRCAPTDSFLWLVLYWAESTRNGFDPHYLDYLRLSYKLGPYEGWIALKRNRFSLALFEQLPPDLAEQVLTEFAGLLESGFDSEVVNIFIGPGWHVRDKLLPHLKTVAEHHRIAFARKIYQLGYDIEVPGVERPGPQTRPWR
jgi:hypothetical protein